MADADPPAVTADVVAAKRALRVEALARRAELAPEVLRLAEVHFTRILITELVPRTPSTVVAYVSMDSEPGTGKLLAALAATGHRVLLPVLRDDLDLDWAVHTGDLQPGPRGTQEPTGQRLGLDAIAEASVVLVPGLLAGRDGTRLGRGGGSYDRALARRSPTARVAMLCFPEEVRVSLPSEPHDARIDAALTPAGLIHLGPP